MIGRKYRSDTRRGDCEGGGVYTNSQYQSLTGGIFDILERSPEKYQIYGFNEPFFGIYVMSGTNLAVGYDNGKYLYLDESFLIVEADLYFIFRNSSNQRFL